MRVVSVLLVILHLFIGLPANGAEVDEKNTAAAEVRDHVYPQALGPVEVLVRRGRVQQKAGHNYQALRLYLQAIEKLGQLKTDNPYIAKAVKDMGADIQSYIGKIKEVVQKQGLILYRGRFYTFEGLQKALKKEAERRARYEQYLRWEAQERRARQDRYWQQEQRRQYEERRLKQDYQFQQEQRRQNEERRRNYEQQMLKQRETEQD